MILNFQEWIVVAPDETSEMGENSSEIPYEGIFLRKIHAKNLVIYNIRDNFAVPYHVNLISKHTYNLVS